jgi:phage-related tail protein
MDAGISVDDLRAGLPQYTGAMQLAGKSTKQLGTTAAGAARDIDRLDQEIDDVINKTFSFEEAQDKAANALARLADQVKEQKKGHEKGAASLTGNTQAARDNRDAVRDLVRLYEDLMVQADEAGQSTAGFKKSLEDQLVAMGFSRDEAQRYTKQLEDVKARLDAIPKTTTITIMTDAERAIAQARETDREIRALYRNPIYVNVVTNPYSYDQGHAHGGIMGAACGGARGGMTWVGERGPELVRLPYGSTVYPAGQSQQMAGGGGGQVEAVLVSTEGISNAAAKALVKLLFPDLRAVVRGLGGPDRAFS